MSVCFGTFFLCENACVFYFQAQEACPDVKARSGFGCEVRTIWGHPQQFESIGICVMSLAQESEVRVPLGSGSW